MTILDRIKNIFNKPEEKVDEITPLKTELADVKSQLKKQLSGLMDRGVSMFGAVYPKTKQTNYLKVFEGWVYANITAIADQVSSKRIKLYSIKANGDTTEITQHPLLELIYRVNDVMTYEDLIYITSCHLELMGESMWYLVGSKPDNPKEQPREIWPMRPDMIKVILGEEGEPPIKGYEYITPNTKQKTFFNYWEVLFIKYIDPENPVRGKSPVSAASTIIDTDAYTNEWNKNFFENSAQPDAVLEVDGELSDSSFKRIKEQWANGYNGVKQARKTAILEGNTKYKPMNISQRDMDFVQQLKWNRDTLMAMWRNPKTIMGLTEDVNRANAEASEMIYAKYNIAPKLRKIESALNEFLVPLFGKNIYLEYENPVPEDKEMELKEYESGLKNGYLTINEVRNEEGLPPVEGGDVIYLPTNLVPIGTDVTKINTPVQPLKVIGDYKKETNLKVVKLKNKDYFETKVASMLEGEIEPMLKKYMVTKTEKSKVTKEEQFSQKQLGRSDIYEEAIEAKLKQIFADEEAEVIASLKNITKSIKTKFSKKEVLDVDKWVQIDLRELLPLFKILYEEQGLEAMDFLGMASSGFIVDQETIKKIEKQVKKFATSITETQQDRLAKVIADGIDQGYGYDKISKLVRNEFNDFSKHQVDTIVRTEVTRTTNYGVLDSYLQSGIVESKKWFTSLDGKVCEYCAPMEGKTTNIERNYFDKGSSYMGNAKTPIHLDYEDVVAPPLHPRCRCTIVPEIAPAEKSNRKTVDKSKQEYVKNLKSIVDTLNEIKNGKQRD